jgi:flavin reductase (DIM6/NTAB) family NADH-FMN oxidoreductase RutF
MPAAGAGFDALMGMLDYPMFIVTARRGDERAGCLIGFATQASIDPSRFLACLSDKNHTYRIARETDHVAVHLVPSHADPLAQLFGGETGDEVDKFARCPWHDGPHGLPILDACENWFAARVLERHALGDHVGFLLEPVVVRHGTAGRQFTFHRAKRIEAGHEA